MEPYTPTVFAFAAFVYDAENRRLTRNRVPVRTNKQMLDLLDLLVRSEGRLVTREQIQNTLWPDQFAENREKQITNAISRLRHILGDNSARPRYIESVPRTGYRLIATINRATINRATIDRVGSEVAGGIAPSVAVDSTDVEIPAAVRSGAAAGPEPNTAPMEQMRSEAAAGSHEAGDRRGLESPGEPNIAPGIEQGLALARLPGVVAKKESLPDRRRALGPRRFSLAVVVLLLFGVVLAVWKRDTHMSPPPPGEISLGIAPFHAAGPGAADLAQSFRLDLTDTLAHLPHVNVRASHSLDLVSLDQTTFRDQATRLGLDVLIIGSFTLEDNQCHVQLELVSGKNLSHIANFDRTVSRFELANLRDMIRNEVYATLKLAPAPGSPSASPVGGTSDPRAYDAYLRASFHYSQLSRESLPLAISEYAEAIAADPQFVNAYAGQARAYIYLVQNDLIEENEGYRLADEAARHALSLNSRAAEAHSALGFIYFLHHLNLAAGENEFKQAVAINPNDPFYHQGLALIFCDQGRFRMAEAEIDQAHIVDPFWASAYTTEAHIASIAGDRSRTQAANRKIMELVPGSAHARDGIGNAQWNLGLHEEAIATWREMAVIEKDASRIAMEDRGIAAYREGGVPAYARVRIEAIRNEMKTAPHTNDFFAAEWYAQANQPEEALHAIHASIAAHDGSVLGLAVIPAYASLHSNSEFLAVLASLGLSLPVRANR